MNNTLCRCVRTLISGILLCGTILHCSANGQTFVQNGVGAQSRSVQSKLADIVNVKDFGAMCDGVTDDSAAFQAAHDSATYGLTINIPPGTCFINKSINVTKHNIKWQGSGQGTTYIIMGPQAMMLFNVTNGTPTQVFAPEFRDFVVDGSRSAAGVAFYFNSVRSVNIQRVYTVSCYRSYVFDATTYGISGTVHLSDFYIEATPDVSGARGILINGGGDDWFISNGRLCQDSQSTSNIGIEVTSGAGLIVNSVDISGYGRAMVMDPSAGKFARYGQFNALQCDSSWSDNLTLDGTAAFGSGYPYGIYSMTFVNSWFSSAGTQGGNGNGINIVSAQGVTIDSSQIYSNSMNGVRIQAAAQNITLSNNQLSNNSNGYGNGQANVGVYSGIAVDNNGGRFSLANNSSGQQSVYASTQKYGVSIGTGAWNYRVIGNDLNYNIAGPYNDLTRSSTAQIGLNIPSSVQGQ
jgi:parallel beta-helix repeat protein